MDKPTLQTLFIHMTEEHSSPTNSLIFGLGCTLGVAIHSLAQRAQRGEPGEPWEGRKDQSPSESTNTGQVSCTEQWPACALDFVGLCDEGHRGLRG